MSYHNMQFEGRESDFSDSNIFNHEFQYINTEKLPKITCILKIILVKILV